MDLSRPLTTLGDLVARLTGSLTDYLPNLLTGIIILLAGLVLAPAFAGVEHALGWWRTGVAHPE